MTVNRRQILAATGVAAFANLVPGGFAIAAGKGGLLRLASSADAQPAAILGGRAGNWLWKRLVFDTLFDQTEKGPVPVLATSFKKSEDGRSIVVDLRTDVKFHSGRAFGPEDVIYTFEQAKVPANGSQLAAAARSIASMEKTGPAQVTFSFAEPTGAIWDLFDLTPIVDKDSFANIKSGEVVVGTGPFRWRRWRVGAEIQLEKNPDYRVPGKPAFDEVFISVITDATALTSALRGEAAQLVYGLTTNDLRGLRQSDKFALLPNGGAVYPLGLNVNQAPFDKVEVRQAVGYAIDRKRIVEQVFGGDGEVTDLWWTPAEGGYPQELGNYYSYDPAKAKALVEKAGAVNASFKVVVPNLAIPKGIFEIVRNNLAAVGLRPEANILDVTTFDARQVAGDLGPAFCLLHGMIGFSAATMLGAMPSLREGNPSSFAAARYLELQKALNAAPDSTKPAALRELSQYMLEQGFSHVTASAPQYLAYSKKVQGFRSASLGCLVATDAVLVG